MKTRVKSAVVLIAVALLCIILSRYTRVLFFIACGGVCAYEYSVNVEKLGARCTLWVLFVYLSGQAVISLLRLALLYSVSWFVFCLYLSLFSGVLHKEVAGKGALYTLAGLSYPCLLFAVIADISASPVWAPVLLLACLSTWLCDTFALLGGTRFGKHKLAPSVSPNKTVEGCLCGALSSLPAGVLVYFITKLMTPLPLGFCLVTGLLASTMGQIGDLAESLLKRMIGVKDFSDLIPGHGGMMDRADSLLFSIPTTYICLIVAGLPA